MKENNNLIVYENGIIGKIKRIFRNLFKKKKEKQIQINIEKEEIKNNFREEIIIPLDKERERILQLQQKIRKQEIKITDVALEDIDKLRKLYDTQIKDLKTKIEQNKTETEKYKNEIIEIRKKLA